MKTTAAPNTQRGSYCVKNLPPMGSIWWFKLGTKQLHRTDGPAIEWPNGCRTWYQNGKLHRTDGPAIEDPHGIPEWRINGRALTEAQFIKRQLRIQSKTGICPPSP